MNLKEYALKYEQPNLSWLDGRILQLTHGIDNDALVVLCRAIFVNHNLIKRFALRNETRPDYRHHWDRLIEETSSELAECLAKLEAA